MGFSKQDSCEGHGFDMDPQAKALSKGFRACLQFAKATWKLKQARV